MSIPTQNAEAQARPALSEALAYFEGMVDRCYDFAEAARAEGRPIVGMLCEFTPRELILAAGGVPVCLCGGSEETIAPAERRLPSNLCPLIKSTYGYHVTGRNPFLKWADLVIAETTCDGKTKMLELLAEDKPVHVLDLPHRAESAEAFDYWFEEIRKLKTGLEERFRTVITKERLREAIQVMNRERGLRRSLAALFQSERPPFTGRQLLDLKSLISAIPEDLAQYERILHLAREEARSGEPGRARPVRVLLTGVPLAHGAERVMELIEMAGAIVVCQENCTGLKPILEDVDEASPDPLRALAAKYYHLPCSVMTSNRQRLESMRALAAEYRPDCVIELVWHACLTYDIEAARVRAFAEETLHLPYLKITTDYSPADSKRIEARLEALMEMIRGQGRAV